jgi:predicted esterase
VIHEHHIAIPRTARYYTLGEAGPGIAEVWFALHGYGQLAGRFVRELAPLDDGSRLIVAPEALSRFYLGGVGERPASERTVGASWMTREDRLAEIDDQVRYLDAVYAEILQGIDRSRARVCVFGFSQGTAAAARWLGYGTARAGRLILWGGEIPPDLDLSANRERFARLDLTLVAGTQDQFITTKILDREKQRLDAHAIPFHLVTFDGGHEIDEAVLRQLAG